MIKNRKLTDLFVRGKEITVDDNDGEIKIWMQKLNASEHESIIRHANAARAKALAMKNDTEGVEYQALSADVLELNKEDMIDLIIGAELMSKATAVESEISEKDEWLENNYLQGLRDAWEDGLSEEFHVEETPESIRVYEELLRFTEQVGVRLTQEKENMVADQLERTLDAVFKDAMEQKILSTANIEWLKAYRKGELVYSCREPENHKERMLDWNSIEEIQEDLFEILVTEYRNLSMDVVEGKD